MLFNSFSFLIFFPIVFIIYYLIRKECRYAYLSIVSILSYIAISPKYALLLIVTTVSVYYFALLIGHNTNTSGRLKAKFLFILCIVLNIGILVVCKYSSFIIGNTNHVLGYLGINNNLSLPLSVFIPLGISFYTLQALGYLIDVYHGRELAEKNFLKILLFASFFPTIVSGPIERSGNLLKQIKQGVEFDYDKIRIGYLTILWGYYEKFVLADIIHPIVINSFESYDQFGALNMILATLLYSVELYADFSGYSHIAIGASGMLGYDICPNFKQPYFATSIKEFWRRWHISLSSYLRDYLYIPLGGSRCSKIKLYRNLFVTFLVSGIWHGVGWCFIVWGIIHGLYQIIGSLTSKIRTQIRKILKLDDKCFSYRLFQMFITFLFVSFGWFFFRADSLRSACTMLEHGITNIHNYSIIDGNAIKNILLFMLPLILVDILKEKGIDPQRQILKQNYIFRWGIYIIGAVAILIIMIRNFGVDASNFIYAQF